MSKIVLTAENFAFGPISKLLFIAELLRKQNNRLIFVGFGTSLQLAKKFPFDEIHEVDTDLESSKESLSKILIGADLLVSSMDLASVAVANELSIPVVWIDCLFWFWESIPEVTHHVKAYIRELTVNDNRNAVKFENKIENLYTVGPIVGEQKNQPRKKQALVSFGGGEASHWYKVGKDTNYPFVMTDVLNRYVDWSSFEKVVIATSEKIIEELTKSFSNTKFEFATLSQQDFIKSLSSSEVLLTTAGLVTTESAFQQQIPIIFLPSSNNSHYLLLDVLRKMKLASASVQLSDFMHDVQIQGLPPHESMKAVMQQLKEFEHSENIKKQVGEKLNSLLETRQDWSEKQVRNSKKYFDSLGGNGASTVVEIIENILKQSKS